MFAANVLPIIRDIQAAGHASFNATSGSLPRTKFGRYDLVVVAGGEGI
jgi:hypothetical protein